MQPWPHHAEPFVVSFQVLVINRCILRKPLLHQWAVYVVVVDPALVAGVVGWIDIDALDTVCIAREQGFEGM